MYQGLPEDVPFNIAFPGNDEESWREYAEHSLEHDPMPTLGMYPWPLTSGDSLSGMRVPLKVISVTVGTA